MKSCKQKQTKKDKKSSCNKLPRNTSYEKLLEILEGRRAESKTITNIESQPTKDQNSNQGKEEGSTELPTNISTEITPEERFTEIEEDEEPVEFTEEDREIMYNFSLEMKKKGILMLAERGQKVIGTTSVIKKDYIMNPDPLPYQDILDAKDNSRKIKEDISPLKSQNPIKQLAQGPRIPTNPPNPPEPSNPAKKPALKSHSSTYTSNPPEPSKPVEEPAQKSIPSNKTQNLPRPGSEGQEALRYVIFQRNITFLTTIWYNS